MPAAHKAGRAVDWVEVPERRLRAAAVAACGERVEDSSTVKGAAQQCGSGAIDKVRDCGQQRGVVA